MNYCLPLKCISWYVLQIAHYLGDKMASKGSEKLTDDFLILVRHPPQCSSMLKVRYN